MRTKLILMASVLLPFLHILFYVWNTTENIVFRDDMYLIRGAAVEKFCQGTLTFADLWRAAGGTRLLGYNLLLVVNTAWFGLNSRAVVLLIPFVLLATACLIYRDYRRSLTGLRSPALIAGTYALPMLLLFNLTLWEGLGFDFAIIFVWSVPWYLASFYMLEDLLVNGRKISWLGAVIITSLAFLVFGQTSSFAFGAALAITFGCYFMLNRQRLPKGLAFRLAAICAVLGLLVFLYLYRIKQNDYSPGSAYVDWSFFTKPWDLLSFVLSTLAASVVGVDAAKSHFGVASIAGVGLLVALLYALALLLYFKTRMYERTYLPLFMIAYAFAFVAFMTVGRFRYGVQYGMASRYTCNTICGIIAIAWIALFVLAKAASTTKLLRIALYTGVILIFAGLLMTSIVEWQIQPFRRESVRRLRDIALDLDTANDDELAAFEARPSWVRDSLQVLRKYQLNVYRTGVHGTGVYRTITPPPPSSVRLALSAAGAYSTHTSSRPGVARVGYATLDCDAEGIPHATAVFRSVQNDNVVSETAMPAATPTTRVRAFIDGESHTSESPWSLSSRTVNFRTGIAIVNRSADYARITYTFRNMEGTILASGRGALASGSHIAKFVTELGDSAPDFRLPADIAASELCGSLEIASDQPISVVALRQITNERNETLITTTPMADLTRAPSKNRTYFPQFVDGGGYTTSLILLNTSNVRETGTFHILDDNGIALPVKQVEGTSDSTFRYSIEPGGVFRFQTDGSPAIKKVGWVQLIPDLNACAPVGMGVFNYRQKGVLITESGIPATIPTTHARIYLDRSLGRDTGLAIGNPSGSATSLTLSAFRMDGSTPADGGQSLVQIPGNGHSSRFAGELIAGLPQGFTGILDVSSQAPLVILALRSLITARKDLLLTAFPVADLTRNPPSPIVFPHIIDGGGYTTEFILLGAGTPITATIRYLGETGLPLAVGK